MEEILVPLAILILLALLVGIITLPILVILQWRRLTALRTRLDRLERLVTAGQPIASPPEAEPPPVEIALVEEPALPAQAAQPIPPPAAPVAPRRREELRRGPATESLETWIGRRGLGWVAVVLLLFATAFFLKQVFENQWIGETGRVALGVLGGLVLCGLGYYYFRGGWRLFSQMLTAGGVVLLYLSIFGAFGYYHLIPQQTAGIFLVVLVAETATLALCYEAPAIALMAVIGGLLSPLLLHTDRDQYRSLFLYLIALNAGTVGLLVLRRWRVIGLVALIGSQVLFWGWYSENYHPEKMLAALEFQGGLFSLYMLYALITHVARRRKAGIEELALLLLNAGLFFAAAYTLLDEDYHVWMGTLAIAFAIVYTVLGWIVLRRNAEDGRLLLATVAIAMGFVAIAIPIQAEAVWVAVGWAIQGLALWWYGLRARFPALRGMGVVLLLLAVGRLLFVNTPELDREPFVPILNGYALPALLVAVCTLAAAAVAWRSRGHLGPLDRAVMAVAGLGGIALVWFIFSVETYEYFDARSSHVMAVTAGPGANVVNAAGQTVGEAAELEAERLRHFGQVALSVVWAVYAVVVLAVGFGLRSGAIRWTALALLAVTLGKVLLVDMAGLPGFYRVAALLAAAVVMAIAAWAYQKLQVAFQGDSREVPQP